MPWIPSTTIPSLHGPSGFAAVKIILDGEAPVLRPTGGGGE
jgi:hypothetical protein